MSVYRTMYIYLPPIYFPVHLFLCSSPLSILIYLIILLRLDEESNDCEGSNDQKDYHEQTIQYGG